MPFTGRQQLLGSKRQRGKVTAEIKAQLASQALSSQEFLPLFDEIPIGKRSVPKQHSGGQQS